MALTNDDKELLIRLDERMANLQKQLENVVVHIDDEMERYNKQTSAELAQLKTQMSEVNSRFDKYVTKEELKPIQKAVFGAIGLILSGVLAALLQQLGIKVK